MFNRFGLDKGKIVKPKLTVVKSYSAYTHAHVLVYEISIFVLNHKYYRNTLWFNNHGYNPIYFGELKRHLVHLGHFKMEEHYVLVIRLIINC